MEYPKTKTQRRYERLIRIIITELAELSESQMLEVRTIVGNMYETRMADALRADEESRARADRHYKGAGKP